jgi:hypothetical protein
VGRHDAAQGLQRGVCVVPRLLGATGRGRKLGQAVAAGRADQPVQRRLARLAGAGRLDLGPALWQPGQEAQAQCLEGGLHRGGLARRG